MIQERARSVVLSSVGLLVALFAASGCQDDDGEGPGTEQPATGGNSGEGGQGGGGSSDKEDTYVLGDAVPKMPAKFDSHLPKCEEELSLNDLPMRLFADDGHLFYFEVTPEAVRAGDTQACDRETPLKDVDCPNFASNVRVVPFGTELCADTGKIELDLRGGKNFRPWLLIPTFKFDSGEFMPGSFGEGDSQLRFHSGQGGSTIVREAIALRIWRALDYPAPRSSFVKTQSNVWDTAYGEGTWAAHLMLQSFKKEFFEEELPGAISVWDGEGDPFGDGWREVSCEWSADDACDDEALSAIISLVQAEESGEGFQARTEAAIDWPSVHAFQCLSALTDAGDDWIHTGDNVVLALSEGGKVSYLPHRLDDSGGMRTEAEKPTPFTGTAFLIQECEKDPSCAAQARSTCGALLDKFEQEDLLSTIVDERCETLVDLDLARDGDTQACEEIRDYYQGAVARVRALL